MSSRRKRSNSNRQPALSNISYYPQYGYSPPSYYNPSYDYSGYTYDPSNYIYYPVDQYGQVIGPPTRFPPITNNPYYEPYLYPDSASTISNHGSHIHSPRRTQLSRHESYHHLPPPPPQYHSPPVRRARERSTHESLPPIHKHVYHLEIFV